MIKRCRIAFYPTIAGILTGAFPLLLLHPRLEGSGVPAVILGMGLPVLVLLALVFLVFRLPALFMMAKKTDQMPLPPLPGACRVGKPLVLEADPHRPCFLPGVRLFLCWRFEFGPFKEESFILLPARGKGTGRFRFTRRGCWKARPSFYVTDPFGFFVFRIPIGIVRHIVVPPEPTGFEGGLPSGRLSTDSETALRLSEDAEEWLERRQYIPGDDSRRIDWRHYARTRELIIRVGEDEIPTRGRLWLQVIGSSRHWKRQDFKRLDRSLGLVMTLVKILTEAGQEVFVRLPGEVHWGSVGRDDWQKRVSQTVPDGILPAGVPAPGDTLCIVSESTDSMGQDYLSHAVDMGCHAVLMASDDHTPRRRSPGWWFFDRRDAYEMGR